MAVIGQLAALWGVLGVAAMLGTAVYRLMPYVLELRDYELGALQLVAIVAWAGFMGWTEGYKGFHLGFSPRVAARARYLREHPRPLHVLFAPFFCFGYFHATRRRQITSIVVSLAIVGLVVLVKQLAQPWRGIVDIGVVLGLSMGIASLFFHAWRALGSGPFDHDPQVPEP